MRHTQTRTIALDKPHTGQRSKEWVGSSRARPLVTVLLGRGPSPCFRTSKLASLWVCPLGYPTNGQRDQASEIRPGDAYASNCLWTQKKRQSQRGVGVLAFLGRWGFEKHDHSRTVDAKRERKGGGTAQAGPSLSRGRRVLWGPLMCEAPTRRGGTVPLPAVRSWAARTSQPGSGAPEAQLRLGGRTDHARPRRLADGGRKPSSQQVKKSCGTRGGHQPWPRAQTSGGRGCSLPLEGREDGDRADNAA